MDFPVTILDRREVFKNDPRFVADQQETVPAPASVESAPQPKFGMKIRELGPADKQSDAIKDKKGVVVTSVDTDSFADDLKLQEGDVIVAINREAVASVDDLRRVQARLKPGAPVAIHIFRPAKFGVQAPVQWESMFLSGNMPSK